MKKIIGSIACGLACLLCGAVLLTGCSDGKTVSDSGVDSSQNSDIKTRAALLSDRLDREDYVLELRIISPSSTPVRCSIVRSGQNGLVSMQRDSVYSRYCTINGESVMLLPEINCYRNIESDSEFGNAFIKLGKNDMLYDISEDNRIVTEIYKPTESSKKETYYFTFDKSTGVLKSAETEIEGDETITTIVESIEWKTERIDPPELDGWEDISDDAFVSDVTAMKVSLYIRGITPDMVKKAGYTYEQLADMDPSVLSDVTDQLLKYTEE